MIIINNLPIPPSANTMYETNVHRYYKPNGNMGIKTSRRKSGELELFQLKCANFANLNHKKLEEIRSKVKKYISEGYVLSLDTWFVFEYSRIFSKDGKPKVLDADNRRKPLQDALSKILNIDDSWFFSGIIEKATCSSKDLEQCITRITPIKAKNLNQINQETGISRPTSPKTTS